MNTCYLDTETLGLFGPAAIIQVRFDYSNDKHDDQPFIFDPWHSVAAQTRELIEEIVSCRVVAHNITFDWAKLNQFYNALLSFEDGERPIENISKFARCLYNNRSRVCLKPPAAVCTLMLSQKHLGGASLASKEIRVRRLPVDMAPLVAATLNQYTDLPEIMFARRQNGDRWSVAQSDAGDAWSDVVLRFGPSNALKDIARLVLGVDNTMKIGAEVSPPEFPTEEGFAPYAVLLADNQDDWTYNSKPLWPELLEQHVEFWTTNKSARQYAIQDVVLLEMLDDYFGNPETDFDSEIGCQVASIRVAGMSIDMDRVKAASIEAAEVVAGAQVNVDSPRQVRAFISECLDAMEMNIIADSCDKNHLKALVKEFTLSEREDCDCDGGCPRCGGIGYIGPGPAPVADRASHVLNVRKYRKRLQTLDKLAVAKSAFPSFRVIGAKSGRMSGADGMNYHGLEGSKEVREIFTLADQQDWIVCGGDMQSQELAITAAVMQDKALGEVLESGKKLHAIFAAEANGVPYEQIMRYADDKTRPESKWYSQGKITSYSILYGASAFKVAMDLGCTPEEADVKIAAFFAKFPGMAVTRKAVKRSLDCLVQSDSGRLVIVKPEQDYIESVFGFRRSFTTELSVMGTMLDAMERFSSRGTWDAAYTRRFADKIVRSEKKGEQTVAAAIKSALYGAVFSLQGKVFRAACNHLIQSSGRTCTLRVQKAIWDKLQPVGIHPFRVKLISVHDEVITTCHRDDAQAVQEAVSDAMNELTDTIPLLSLDWATDVKAWYGAKTCEGVRTGWGRKDEDL